MRLAIVLLALIVLAGRALPLAAQVNPEAELETLVERLSGSWEDGDVESVTGVMVPDGILLHLPDAVHPGLSIRMARAALEELHQRAGSGRVEVDRVRLLGGAPARASLELLWHPLPPGMANPRAYTVFMGFQRTSEGWRISEIRILGGAPKTDPVPEPPHLCR